MLNHKAFGINRQEEYRSLRDRRQDWTNRRIRRDLLQRMSKYSLHRTGDLHLELDEKGRVIVRNFIIDVVAASLAVLAGLITVAVLLKKFF